MDWMVRIAERNRTMDRCKIKRSADEKQFPWGSPGQRNTAFGERLVYETRSGRFSFAADLLSQCRRFAALGLVFHGAPKAKGGVNSP